MSTSTEVTVPGNGTSPEKRTYWPLVVKFVIDVAIPVAGYYALRAFGVPQLTALVLTSVPAVGYFAYRLVRGRRIDAFEVFVLAVVAASNTASVLDGSARLLLSMDGWVSLALALACLVSLAAGRPLVYLLIRSLLDNTPARERLRTREWDWWFTSDSWFRKPWVYSTKVWAGLCVLTGAIRLGIAFLAPVDLAPLLLGIMAVDIVVFLQFWQSWYLRRHFRKGRGFLPEQDRPEPVGRYTYFHQLKPRTATAE